MMPQGTCDIIIIIMCSSTAGVACTVSQLMVDNVESGLSNFNSEGCIL